MPEHDDPRTDQQLVAAVNRGDEAAFAVLYRRHRDWVLRLAWRFGGSRDDAPDVMQETFAYLLGKFPGFELRAKLTTFLYPAVKHIAIGRRAKAQRFASAEQSFDDLPALPDAGDAGASARRQELAAVVGGLPEGQREVLLMRFVDGLALAEIAEALAIPLGTVKSRLHNALRALRDDPRVREYFER